MRVKMEENIAVSENNDIILDTRSVDAAPRMVTTDKSGTVCFIYFDGRVEKEKIKEFPPEHFFDYMDINGDGFLECIFIDNKKLEVYNYKKSLLFSYSFENNIEYRPIVYTFSSTDKKIGVVSEQSNKIYLFNNDGKLYKGFPVSGNTLYSIGRFQRSDRKYNLIVGSKDNFLYNYSVKEEQRSERARGRLGDCFTLFAKSGYFLCFKDSQNHRQGSEPLAGFYNNSFYV